MKQLHLPGMEPKQKISNEPKSAYVEKQKAKQKPTDPIVNHVIKTMVQYDDVPAEDYAVKYNPTTGLFSNKERDIAFQNYNDAEKWNQSIGVQKKTVKEKPVRPRPFKNEDPTTYPSNPKQKRDMSLWDMMVESAKKPKDRYDKEDAKEVKKTIMENYNKPTMRKYLSDDELKLIGKHKSQLKPVEPINIVPINIPRFEPIKKDPETERLEARFKEIIRENEEEKIKNENTGIGGLLGGKI